MCFASPKLLRPMPSDHHPTSTICSRRPSSMDQWQISAAPVPLSDLSPCTPSMPLFQEGPWAAFLGFALCFLSLGHHPSPSQVRKSLLPMSASKLVYPPPISAFITLPKWSDISSVEASRRRSRYPNHKSWHNKWRQSAGGLGHLSHRTTSRCQLHYSLKLPEKIT